MADPLTPRTVYSHLGTGELANTGGVNRGVNKSALLTSCALAEGLNERVIYEQENMGALGGVPIRSWDQEWQPVA